MQAQLSRTALLYFFAAFSACILLLAIFLPWWILPVAGFCLAWRFLVFNGRLSFPSAWVKSSLVLLSGIALFQQYGFSVSLDVFVMLLLMGFSLKLLELYHQEDAQFLLYLSFFVLMTVFLFEQTPGYMILVFVVVFLVLAAMVAIQSADSELQEHREQPLRKAGLVFVLALPVMLFMFVVMPRLPPLWTMPLQKQQQGKTGMNDSMSPGDIASLARSSELVFRASFPDGVPDRRELYWYGMVLDYFDGQRWTDSCNDCREQWARTDRLTGQRSEGLAYQVILEPHGNKWLYALMPSSIWNPAIWMDSNNIFRFERDVSQREIYEARYLKQALSKPSVLQDSGRYLALPVKGNTRSRALAQDWKTASPDTKAIVQKALAFYRESFSYTLQPPLLGDQRIDDFLFNTRSGFCEHFASSFVFLMRAAGVPARVVVGYMGGEIHEPDRYVVVRQYDAHAWAEVWLADMGWVRVDPTAAVAPERVDLGFADAFSGNADFVFDAGLAAFKQFPILNSLRLQLDRIDYLWARWVLGYEGDQQQALLKALGLFSPWRIAAWGGGGVTLVFVLLCLYLYWREWNSLHEPLATRCYRQLCHAYASYGVERLPAETPLQYANRIMAKGLRGADVFYELSRQYYHWCYSDTGKLPDFPSPDFLHQARVLRWQLLLHGVMGRSRDKY